MTPKGTTVRVTIMPRDGVLDPEGRAIAQALASLGFDGVAALRAGKIIELDLAEPDPARAQAAAQSMADRLLANPVIETARVELA